jgi:ketosteroid isomerase-like protein
MTKIIGCCLSLLVLGGSALAQDTKTAPPSGMPDMSKMGPMSRPVTKEDKKGIDATYKAMEEAWKNKDVNALADLVDFPVIMLSDDSTGAAKSFNATREQWIGIMKPFMENAPKDMKMSHKHSPTFLSDTLAVSIEETKMDMGKQKGKWKSFSVLNLKDGKWKFKQMAEAGWGDMKPPSTAAAPGAPSTTAKK